VGSLVLLGGGAVATVGNLALASVAVAGSRTSDSSGALVDVAIESRNSRMSLLLRTQRLLGDYEDLASWTAVLPPTLGHDRAIFGEPRELEQASASMALPWKGASAGASYIRSIREDQSSQLVNLSFTQDIGPLSLFASVSRDFQLRNSMGIFFGLSLPLGAGVSSSVGASHSGGKTSAYVEASQQGHHTPGSFGWTARATEGDQPEQEAIVRYGAQFARFEAGVQHTDTGTSGSALMEGGLTLIGGGLHASQRVDDSFALVVVGVPGVPILRENRVAGLTDGRGQLIVPHLSPFVANRIALDPTNLPVDAEASATSAVVAPFSRVPALVDLRVAKGGQSAVVTFVDPSGHPLSLGSEVQIGDAGEPFVVGYDGDTFMQRLRDHNVAVITTPDSAVCHASFDYRPSKGEQVRIQAICHPPT
jgi:outer membrane usher protein